MAVMKQYRRLPSLLVLVAVAAVGFAYLRFWIKPASAGQDGSLEDLRKLISYSSAQGRAISAETWFAYGQRLEEAGDFAAAANTAYRNLLELTPGPHQEPLFRKARRARAIALARANDRDGLATLLRDLTYTEPKLVMEILERGECRPLLGDPRLAGLQKHARAQAMD
jgi:hypothetical protein